MEWHIIPYKGPGHELRLSQEGCELISKSIAVISCLIGCRICNYTRTHMLHCTTLRTNCMWCVCMCVCVCVCVYLVCACVYVCVCV